MPRTSRWESAGERRRGRYLVALLAVVLLGLATRRFPQLVPQALEKYPGDALWALMVYLGWGLLLPRASTARVAGLALLTSFSVEVSQRFHPAWLDALRATPVGHLVLGSAFHWGDFLAYAVGIGLGAVAERLAGVGRAVAALRSTTLLAVCWLSVAARASAPAPSAPSSSPQDDSARLFRYDARASLELHEVGRESRGDVVVRDLRFTPTKGGAPVSAFLVEPPGPGPFAAVLWVHWLGEPETTNRTEFLAEAVALASRGVVSLLVDAMWSVPGWYEARVPEDDFERSVRQVVALRRALDLLAAQPHVDRARLGLVGHDYGAMYGMLAAGADQRTKTHVFLAAASSLNDWAFFDRQPVSKAAYLRQNAGLELTDALHRLRGSVLFQFAEHDAYVSRSDAAVLLAAVGGPKERHFYDADHALAVPQAAEERARWLTRELGLEGSPDGGLSGHEVTR